MDLFTIHAFTAYLRLISKFSDSTFSDGNFTISTITMMVILITIPIARPISSLILSIATIANDITMIIADLIYFTIKYLKFGKLNGITVSYFYAVY